MDKITRKELHPSVYDTEFTEPITGTGILEVPKDSAKGLFDLKIQTRSLLNSIVDLKGDTVPWGYSPFSNSGNVNLVTMVCDGQSIIINPGDVNNDYAGYCRGDRNFKYLVKPGRSYLIAGVLSGMNASFILNMISGSTLLPIFNLTTNYDPTKRRCGVIFTIPNDYNPNNYTHGNLYLAGMVNNNDVRFSKLCLYELRPGEEKLPLDDVMKLYPYSDPWTITGNSGKVISMPPHARLPLSKCTYSTIDGSFLMGYNTRAMYKNKLILKPGVEYFLNIKSTIIKEYVITEYDHSGITTATGIWSTVPSDRKVKIKTKPNTKFILFSLKKSDADEITNLELKQINDEGVFLYESGKEIYNPEEIIISPDILSNNLMPYEDDMICDVNRAGMQRYSFQDAGSFPSGPFKYVSKSATSKRILFDPYRTIETNKKSIIQHISSGILIESVPFTETISSNFALYVDSNQNNTYIDLPNSETGWGTDYIPTKEEIKAYLYGWKMYKKEDNGEYNGTGTKMWMNPRVPTEKETNITTVSTTAKRLIFTGFFPTKESYFDRDVKHNIVPSYPDGNIVFESTFFPKMEGVFPKTPESSIGKLLGVVSNIGDLAKQNIGYNSSIYVSASKGDDSNDGTLGSPIKSLMKLRRILMEKYIFSTVDIYLDGTFKEPLLFDSFLKGYYYIKAFDSKNLVVNGFTAWGGTIEVLSREFTQITTVNLSTYAVGSILINGGDFRINGDVFYNGIGGRTTPYYTGIFSATNTRISFWESKVSISNVYDGIAAHINGNISFTNGSTLVNDAIYNQVVNNGGIIVLPPDFKLYENKCYNASGVIFPNLIPEQHDLGLLLTWSPGSEGGNYYSINKITKMCFVNFEANTSEAVPVEQWVQFGSIPIKLKKYVNCTAFAVDNTGRCVVHVKIGLNGELLVRSERSIKAVFGSVTFMLQD